MLSASSKLFVTSQCGAQSLAIFVYPSTQRACCQTLLASEWIHVIIFHDSTMFHKNGTLWFSCYNFSKCRSILILKDISLCSLRIFLTCWNVFYLLNYKIWARYKTKIKDVHELRERIVDEWDKLDQRIIDKAVGVWWKTLSLCGCRWRRLDYLTVC